MSKEIKGEKISPDALAEDILNAISNDNFEIHTGATAMLHKLYQSSPNDAILMMNGIGND